MKHRFIKARVTYSDDWQQRARQFYNGKRWAALRATVMHKRGGLCEACAAVGLVTAAAEVDHVQPHRGDEHKFFDEANLQLLCKPCHSAKTYSETVGVQAEDNWSVQAGVSVRMLACTPGYTYTKPIGVVVHDEYAVANELYPRVQPWDHDATQMRVARAEVRRRLAAQPSGQALLVCYEPSGAKRARIAGRLGVDTVELVEYAAYLAPTKQAEKVAQSWWDKYTSARVDVVVARVT